VTSAAQGPIRVSVVVPVYNPGPHLQPLLDSLDAQTLPAEQFEAVFVDDGSTDETPATLDRLAEQRPNVRVIHQENSGWPGKPRNVGIDAARGTYVFFCDNDDWLGTEALQRLCDAADATGADVVVGKMAGHNRGVPRELFRRTVLDATLDNTPLIDSLTPHKLFRREFLDRHGLRFPEGRRRLEDHVFVVRAYLLASRIAVLGDYVYYHHIRREDSSNAGFTDIDPPSYYGYVRETLAIVEEHVPPGRLRDRLLRRFLRQELLSRLDARRVLEYDENYRATLFTEVQRLMLERFPDTVEAGLPGRQRLLARVVRTGTADDVVHLARWSSGVRLQCELDELAWQERQPGQPERQPGQPVLHLAFRAHLNLGEGQLLRRDGERLLLGPPDGAREVDVAGEIGRVRAELVVRQRGGGDAVLPTEATVEVDATGTLAVAGTAVLDPQAAAAGSPLGDGTWDVSVRFRGLGWSTDTRLGAARSVAAERGVRTVVLGSPPTARRIRPYWTTPHGNLSLAITPATSAAPDARPPVVPRGLRRRAHRLRARTRRRAATLARRLPAPVFRWLRARGGARPRSPGAGGAVS